MSLSIGNNGNKLTEKIKRKFLIIYMSKYYLAGAFRDGCLSTQWQIKIKQKSKKWLSNVIIPMLNEEFQLNLTDRAIFIHEDKNKRYYIAFKNKRVWKRIRQLFEMNEIWNTPYFVKECQDINSLKMYIRGFWDAEGGLPRDPKNSKRYLDFTQKNPEPLIFIRDILKSRIGIKCGELRISDKKGEVWRFAITGKEGIQKFAANISSSHPDKSTRLNSMLTS